MWINLLIYIFPLDSNQSEADRSVQQAEEIAMTLDSDYQALSSKEETDIEVLIAESENAISNAEAFAQQLAKDLSVLDGVCIYRNFILN